MAILVRTSLKAYFETGDVMTAQSFVDLIDSAPSLIDTTAQTFNSDIVVPNLIATNVSAGSGGITGRLQASAATFTGRTRQGVSAAASAADSRGDIVCVQETTVQGVTTAQIAFLPSTSNIVGFAVKVLAASSAAAGGTEIAIGTNLSLAGNANHIVSANGVYQVVSAAAGILTGVSGAIIAAGITATAASNFIVVTKYYQRA